MMRLMIPVFAILTIPAALSADVTARFVEGAPKDRFVFTSDTCPADQTNITLDLSTAPAGLIFDVTAAGAGVEVFQPVEVIEGQVSIAPVTDGDQVLALDVKAFGPSSTVSISADIDDTLENGASGQIIVRGSEIVGATVIVTTSNGTSSAMFDENGQAVVAMPSCLG